MDQTEDYESKFITSTTSIESESKSESKCESKDLSAYYDKKCTSEETSESSGKEPELSSTNLIDCVSVTVPYTVNRNFEYLNRGSLVFVDYEGTVRPLYRTPQSISLHKFLGTRFIAASSSLGRFNVVRTIMDGSTVLEQLDTNNQPFMLTSNDSNFAADSKLNVSYIVGNNEIYGIRENGVRFLTRRLPPSNMLDVQVVAVGQNESVYTAAKVSGVRGITIPDVVGRPIPTTNIPREFHNLGIVNGIGYIVHISNVMNLLLVKADDLIFRGMYFYNNRLVVTGSYIGQMYISHSPPSFKKIAKEMPDVTSFIVALDANLEFVWYRLITSDNACHNVIGDVTINKLGQVFTTCRFKGNIALSDYNSLEIDKHIQSEDEAMVLIALEGEFTSCRNNVISSWWRKLPISFPQSQVSDYVSLTNNGYDIFMSAYTSTSLSRAYNVSDHYFVAAFTPKLVDLFYHPIKNSTNRYNSRIIAYNGSSLFTGSTTWNNLVVQPYGLISEILQQTGYYLTMSLKGPRLIGIVVDRDDNTVHVQFKGYTNVYVDAKVGRNYYVDLPLTTENAAVLTPNPHGSLESLRYYGTAVKDGIILID